MQHASLYMLAYSVYIAWMLLTLYSFLCISLHIAGRLCCVCTWLLCCCFLVTLEYFIGSDFRLKRLCNLMDVCYQICRKAIDLLLSVLPYCQSLCQNAKQWDVWLCLVGRLLLINEFLILAQIIRVTGTQQLPALFISSTGSTSVSVSWFPLW